MRYFSVLFFLFLISCKSVSKDHIAKSTINDGAIKFINNQSKAWDSSQKQWTSVENFWLAYAEKNGGLTWGKGSKYPPYQEVKEFDTFLVEVEQGSCLMEFFHSRWRRANDVQRWDPQHNEYSGCPYVFD